MRLTQALDLQTEKRMPALESRINAIFSALDAAYVGGTDVSSASKGNEREQFVNAVLNNAFPPHYRFASGDIIDSYGAQSGQVDVVLEQPRSYSFPLLAGGPRLYLAESVAAVLSSQWNQVEATADKLATIRRKYSSDSFQEILDQLNQGQISVQDGTDVEKLKSSLGHLTKQSENIGEERIRFFVVGFSGWSTNETIISKLADDKIDGILQIDRRVFCTKLGRAPGFEAVEGYKSLLSFLHWLEVYFQKVPDRFGALSLY